MNVIRFLHQQTKPSVRLQGWIYGEINYLSRNLEYHLLGNHLLENGFAILMAGYYFQNRQWIGQAEKLLAVELEEQILSDGAHFELSPMYHQIILFRVLEALDYLPIESKLNPLLLEKAKKMLAWLQAMTFSNGDIPHFNDSADGIAFNSLGLIDYARKLNILPENNHQLGVSGYLLFRLGMYECAVDAAAIGPSYQPGHGHADALSFILYANGRPLLVEAGTSTYNDCPQRQLERSTRSHNSVEVNGQNQSEVYGAFRVGRRATVNIHEVGDDVLAASHDGYKSPFGITHRRKFQFENERLTIIDTLSGKKAKEAIASFHFHPDVIVNTEADQIVLNDDTVIHFEGAYNLTSESYQFSIGFNQTLSATVLRVYFTTKLHTTINFKR
nr:alginate lyase family protein [Lunatimonas sp.]